VPSGCGSRIYRFSSVHSESLVAGGGQLVDTLTP
jgi:hypothetical protein